jgi:RNA polymerase II subunit A small phosphatase-like protein
VIKRPGVEKFLERMSRCYELVLFTASLMEYANPLMKIIDPQGHVEFQLYRESCTLLKNAMVKDLSRLGRNMKDVIIVDVFPP